MLSDTLLSTRFAVLELLEAVLVVLTETIKSPRIDEGILFQNYMTLVFIIDEVCRDVSAYSA